MKPEEVEQIAVFEWADFMSLKYPVLRLMFHTKNEGNKSIGEAKKDKRMGVRAGVPDIFLPVSRGGFHGLFIEMKRQSGGRLTAVQSDYIRKLRMQGYQAIVCEGRDAAISTITAYLEGDE